MSKYKFVADQATVHFRLGRKMVVTDLINLLNQANYTTNSKTPFKKGRGIYKLISASYARAANQNEADSIALTYIKPDGSYAYK